MHVSLLSLATLGLPLVSAATTATEQSTSNAPNNGLVPQTHKSIEVDCSLCPFAVANDQGGRHGWASNVPSTLKFDINTDGQSLLLNGLPFYPIPEAPGVPPQPLHVSQTMKPGVVTDVKPHQGDVQLSYSLESAQEKFASGNEAIVVRLSVLALDGEMVKIADVEMTALKSPEGLMTLNSLELIRRDPNSADSQCADVMCRIYAQLLSAADDAKRLSEKASHKMHCAGHAALNGIKSLAGFPSQPPPPRITNHRRPNGSLELPHNLKALDGLRPLNHAEHHKHHNPHHHHSHHHHHNVQTSRERLILLILRTARIAFAPIVVGIVVGMAAGAIGMLVGSLIVLVWTRFRRSQQTHVLPEYEALPLYTDEKSSFACLQIVEKAGLPAYEDAAETDRVVDEENA